jgi:hypothetical protein
VKPSGPEVFFVVRFSVTDLISLFAIDTLRFSVLLEAVLMIHVF